MSVPKIIMQTWKTQDVPDKWKRSQESIRKHLPDYQYVLLTDEDNREFVKQYFPDYLSTFDSFPHPIQRADMIRPMWLYINGGVYMDLDFEIQKDFSSLLETGELFLVSSGNIGASLTNSFMASVPRHPLWLLYLERMKEPVSVFAITKHFEVMTTTGPLALTSVVKNNEVVYSSLPQKFLMPCSVCDDRDSDVCNGYLRPLEGQSWNSWDSLVLNFLMCHWKKIVILVIFLLFCWLVWRYTHPPPKMCKC